MSLNSLLSESTDKGWANLYVNTMTAYNGLTVENGAIDIPAETYVIKFQSEGGLVEYDFKVSRFSDLVVCHIPEIQMQVSNGADFVLQVDSSSAQLFNSLKPESGLLNFPIWLRHVTEANGGAVNQESILGVIQLNPTNNHFEIGIKVETDGSVKSFFNDAAGPPQGTIGKTSVSWIKN